jgi:hypothetical protein
VRQISAPHPVKLFVGMLAPRADLFEIAQTELAKRFGPIDAAGEITPFDFTNYYEAEMGPNLKRKFVGFERLINPKELVSAKLFTIDLEERISERFGAGQRIVNLDPGYVSLAKLVLASTKDYTHRVYLGDGVFGEVTLHFAHGRFNPWPWTYPDYKTDDYLGFFEAIRRQYRDALKKVGS